MEDYLKVRGSVEANSAFLDKRYVRFEATGHQQKTFFVENRNCNVLEIKRMTTATK